MVDRLSTDRDNTRKAVLREAEKWLGTPYRHQGSRASVGCDCLGLVRGIWRALYGCEPEGTPNYALDWSVCDSDEALLVAAKRHCTAVPINAARPGDLLVFRWQVTAAARHLAILAPENRIIHAYERHAVCRSALVPHWRQRIAGAFSFPPLPKET